MNQARISSEVITQDQEPPGSAKFASSLYKQQNHSRKACEGKKKVCKEKQVFFLFWQLVKCVNTSLHVTDAFPVHVHPLEDLLKTNLSVFSLYCLIAWV